MPNKHIVKKSQYIFNAIYTFAAIALGAFSFMLIVTAGGHVYRSLSLPIDELTVLILDAIGLVIIAIALFDVARYILEEEVAKTKELRSPHEARKTLTKFIVIIFIAVSLESLVYTFIASKQDIRLLIYPAALLCSAVFLIIGLGIYQKLSIQVEKETQE